MYLTFEGVAGSFNPNNTLELNLEQNYVNAECALTEISFPTEFPNYGYEPNLNMLEIKLFNSKVANQAQKERENIRFVLDSSVEHINITSLLNYINSKILKYFNLQLIKNYDNIQFIKNIVTDGFSRMKQQPVYVSPEYSHIQSVFLDSFLYRESNNVTDEEKTIEVYLQNSNKSMGTVNGLTLIKQLVEQSETYSFDEIQFSKTLANILGFQHDKIYTINTVAERISDINAGLYTIYIYCDLLTPQHIGGVQSKILATVGIPRDTMYYNKIYSKPAYKRLLINRFSALKLAILDNQGEIIYFKSNNKILLTLHIRETRGD